VTPDPHHPGGNSPDPEHPQDRPSLRLQMAAVLLRCGEPPQQVAARTRVPLALIELIAEEISSTDAQRPTQSAAADVHPATVPATAADADLAEARAMVRRGRRRVMLVRIVLVALAVNLAASVAADLGHHPALGVVSVILAPTLILALIWTSTHPPRPHRPRPLPPQH